MKITFHTYDLHLKHVFTIARGSIQTRRTLVVELTQDGLSGFGEATESTYYGVTIDGMIEALKNIASTLERNALDDPSELWDLLNPALGAYPAAQCALDQAAYDLWGKRLGEPVFRLWNLEQDRAPLTNYTLGIDKVEVMLQKMREFPDWPIYKIKVGTRDDIEIITALRAHTQSRFRVDANCGWTEEQTLENAVHLAKLGVEFIEQPLAASEWEAMQRVYSKSRLPIIADESCVVPADVKKCGLHFHGINIKLSKCGGLTPARRMINQAKSLGLRTMLGCMTESSVGISAMAQLAPLVDYVDMDGALLLSHDIARGVTIENGVVTYASSPGFGVTLL